MSELAGPLDLSILILTLNEAENLPRCLDALAWCDDVVVVDSGSTDRTQEIARQRGARVLERRFDNFAAQRNFAIDNANWKHAWVLHLDADEVVTDELVREMRGRIGKEPYSAYRVPSRLMLGENWLRYCGDYPTYQVRLGRVDRLRFHQVGHGQREALAPNEVGQLEADYLHYSFSKGIDDWFERHNRYSRDEAAVTPPQVMDTLGGLLSPDRTTRRRSMKALANYVPFRGVARFFYLFVIRRGFLDGRAGLLYCRMMATYENMISVKRAFRRTSDRLGAHYADQ